jgi:GT2 family glycosyltransferase
MKGAGAGDVWTVIVTWNSREHIIGCLQDLVAQAEPTRILVVDNASEDGTLAAIAEQFPDIATVPLDRNYGFARAVNCGVEGALAHGANYVLLLNPDTRLGTDVTAGLVAAMRGDPGLGIASPKVYLEGKPRRVWGVGGQVDVSGVTFIGMDVEDDEELDAARLDFVLGCALLVRATVLRQIGLLDPRFFAFFEEIDLCLRAAAAGWRIGSVPTVAVAHAGGASTRRRPAFRAFHLGRSRMLFLRKYWPRFDHPLVYRREVRNLAGATAKAFWAGQFRTAGGLLSGTVAGLLRQPPSPASCAPLVTAIRPAE